MGIGHIGLGLALKKAEPRLNAGLLVFATLLADFLLGVFALLGLERAHVPPDYARLHYLTFTFPWSHGLAATLVWSALAYALVLLVWRGRERAHHAALLVALAVFSHFPLDALVHTAELPLLGESTLKLGLGLWNHLTLELSLEALMLAAGLILYGQAARVTTSFRRRVVFCALMALLGAGAIATQALSTTPPPAPALTLTWLTLPLFFAGLCFAFDRVRRRPFSAARNR